MGDGHAKDPWLKLAWSVWGITSLSLTTVLTTLIRTMHKGGIWSLVQFDYCCWRFD